MRARAAAHRRGPLPERQHQASPAAAAPADRGRGSLAGRAWGDLEGEGQAQAVGQPAAAGRPEVLAGEWAPAVAARDSWAPDGVAAVTSSPTQI